MECLLIVGLLTAVTNFGLIFLTFKNAMAITSYETAVNASTRMQQAQDKVLFLLSLVWDSSYHAIWAMGLACKVFH